MSSPDRVEQSEIGALRRRVADTRRVRLPDVANWERGTDARFLADLLEYWADGYDWRVHEERIRSLPWERTAAGPTLHRRAGDDAPALLLLHGWPDSVLRFERVLPLLDDVNVVVPPLPGYPYADPVTQVGTSAQDMAAHVTALMAELGYERYVVSGGDIGSNVAQQLAYRHRESVTALHLTDLLYSRVDEIDVSERTDDEHAYARQLRQWRRAEGAYAHEHSTKPHTLAVGLGDSPAGLAAWIVEKLRAWTDCDGDVLSVFTRDELLTWVSVYWFTNTIGTSFGPYYERPEPLGRIEVPTYVTQFPHDIVSAPRSIGERFYDIRAWHDETSGGHFGAWERPQVFLERLREAF